MDRGRSLHVFVVDDSRSGRKPYQVPRVQQLTVFTISNRSFKKQSERLESGVRVWGSNFFVSVFHSIVGQTNEWIAVDEVIGLNDLDE